MDVDDDYVQRILRDARRGTLMRELRWLPVVVLGGVLLAVVAVSLPKPWGARLVTAGLVISCVVNVVLFVQYLRAVAHDDD